MVQRLYEVDRPLLAVYCGSQLGKPAYQESVIDLAQCLAQAGFGMVYGGASIGLMGVMADTMLAAGAPVVGVIPEFMLSYEIGHQGLTTLEVVDSMHVRKARMAEYAAGFLALAGGLGTLEELTEMATWKQLGQHDKPIVAWNDRGYFNGLQQQLDCAIDQGFMRENHREIIHFIDHPAEVVQHLSGCLLQKKTVALR